MIKPTFTVLAGGLEALRNLERLRKIAGELKNGGMVVKAGVLGDKASAQHGNSGATNIEVAMWNEFGTDRIPARSFIRGPLAANASKYKAMLRKLTPSVLEGKTSPAQMLSLVGTAMASDMRTAIVSGDGIPPPNAPSTIAAKGSSRPLIDTGQLRQSITYVVGVDDKE